MAVPEWLFGPAGDLRPLPAPGADVVNTVQRFGGVHNAINGARTVDVLGHRSNYEFELPFLEPEEYYWVEALYTETIPGPFYLVDPLRKNLFSRELATGRPADASGRGVSAYNSGALSWNRIVDSPISWLQRGVVWSNLTSSIANGAGLALDKFTYVPVLPDKDVTFSVYAKSNQEIQVHWTVRYYNSSGAEITANNTKPLVTLPAGQWTRVTQSFTTPYAEAVTILPEFWYEPGGTATSSTSVQLIGFQAEFGSSATEAALGGGAAKVVIDTMDTTSPRFPYQTVALKLLEV